MSVQVLLLTPYFVLIPKQTAPIAMRPAMRMAKQVLSKKAQSAMITQYVLMVAAQQYKSHVQAVSPIFVLLVQNKCAKTLIPTTPTTVVHATTNALIMRYQTPLPVHVPVAIANINVPVAM